VEQNKLFGILDTKISKISGFFEEEDGQYVGPVGANTLNLLVFIKLYKVRPRGLFTRQPHD